MKKILLSLLFCATIMNAQTATISYHVSIAAPHTHYARVTIQIDQIQNDYIDFKMPVWAPGSYLVREFEKSVENFAASSSNNTLQVERPDKNTWRVRTKGMKSVVAAYDVYCFEASVRTSFIDEDHAFLLGTSCLMFADQYKEQKGSIEFSIPSGWKSVSTSLEQSGNGFTYSFDNYDLLSDSPFELGNQEILKFTAAGVPHEVAMVGRNNCNTDQFIKDLIKVCNTMTNVIGEHPCKKYVFIVHHVEAGGGGLEHLNSCCVQMPRFAYNNPDRYRQFLGLCAHEYFHLWNVKRIRPIELGPFNYNQENYTNLLWVAEGITSFYDELAMERAGFIDSSKLLNTFAGYLNDIENRPGTYALSLAQNSKDAWIREYRPNENSRNTGVSYYSKGLVVAMLLNAEIVAASNGKKNLDDVLLYCWNEYYKKKNRGFSDAEFTAACSAVAGKDLKDFMNRYVFGTEPLPYAETLAAAGIEVKVDTTRETGLGASIAVENNKSIIKSLDKTGPAYESGLNANDELIALNNTRINGNTDELMKTFKDAESWEFIISRSGQIRTIRMAPGKVLKKTYSLKAIKSKSALLKKWIGA